MKYLRNRWYVAGWASELTAEAPLLGRTILDEPIVFFRNGPGIGALRDQCPHRFAPCDWKRHRRHPPMPLSRSRIRGRR